MDVSGKTRLLGVIGHPIEDSLGPRMHNAAFAGLREVSSGRMLLYQGVHAQRLRTGREPGVRAMSDALA